MAVFSQNPFEGSFENLTAKAGRPVKKAAADAAKGAAEDIKQAVTGKTLAEEAGLEEVSGQDQAEIERRQKQVLEETRRNVQEINAAMARIRRERQERQAQASRQVQQERQAKKTEEKKKREEPAWKRMLKGKMGSRESATRAGG